MLYLRLLNPPLVLLFTGRPQQPHIDTFSNDTELVTQQ